MTVAYVKLHCMTLHCGHCITLHYITHHIVTWITHITYTTVHYISSHCIKYIALHCITLHYIALHCITLHFIALRCTTLPCVLSQYIALHTSHHTTTHVITSHDKHYIALHCTILPYFTWYSITLQYFHTCMYCIDAVLIELEIHIYIHYIPFLSFAFHSIPFIPYVQTYAILPTGTLCCPSPE